MRRELLRRAGPEGRPAMPQGLDTALASRGTGPSPVLSGHSCTRRPVYTLTGRRQSVERMAGKEVYRSGARGGSAHDIGGRGTRPLIQLCCHCMSSMTCAYRCRSLCPRTHSAHGAMAAVALRVPCSCCCPGGGDTVVPPTGKAQDQAKVDVLAPGLLIDGSFGPQV